MRDPEELDKILMRWGDKIEEKIKSGLPSAILRLKPHIELDNDVTEVGVHLAFDRGPGIERLQLPPVSLESLLEIYWTDIGSSTIEDGVRVEWVDIGEGRSGDYNSDDPNDERLLRFYVSRLTEDGWVDIKDASYCTNMPVATGGVILKEATQLILDRVKDKVLAGESIKKDCEELSYIDPSWVNMDPPKVSGEILEGFIAASTGVGGADFVELVADLCERYKGCLRIEFIPKDDIKILPEDRIQGGNLDEVTHVFVFYEVDR